MKIDRSIGDALLRVRQARLLSQRAFGKLLGVSHVYICKVETGGCRLSAEHAVRWALELDEPPCEWARLALQDQLNAAGLRMTVRVS